MSRARHRAIRGEADTGQASRLPILGHRDLQHFLRIYINHYTARKSANDERRPGPEEPPEPAPRPSPPTRGVSGSPVVVAGRGV